MTESRREAARRLGLMRANAEAYYHRGLKNYAEGDLENAILDVSEAIYNDRNHPEYYTTRGMFYLENGQRQEAEIDLNYAVSLGKRQWIAQHGLGVLRFTEGDFAAARDHFTQALQFGDNRAEVWFYRAATLFQLGEYEQAAADMEQALKRFDPNDKRLREAQTWKREIERKLPGKPDKAGETGEGGDSAPKPRRATKKTTTKTE